LAGRAFLIDRKFVGISYQSKKLLHLHATALIPNVNYYYYDLYLYEYTWNILVQLAILHRHPSIRSLIVLRIFRSNLET
jgi:hypothetical protein